MARPPCLHPLEQGFSLGPGQLRGPGAFSIVLLASSGPRPGGLPASCRHPAPTAKHDLALTQQYQGPEAPSPLLGIQNILEDSECPRLASWRLHALCAELGLYANVSSLAWSKPWTDGCVVTGECGCYKSFHKDLRQTLATCPTGGAEKSVAVSVLLWSNLLHPRSFCPVDCLPWLISPGGFVLYYFWLDNEPFLKGTLRECHHDTVCDKSARCTGHSSLSLCRSRRCQESPRRGEAQFLG